VVDEFFVRKSSRQVRNLARGSFDDLHEAPPSANPTVERVNDTEDEGMEGDRENRHRDDQALRFFRDEPVAHPKRHQDERKFSDLRQARSNRQRRMDAVAIGQDDDHGGDRLREQHNCER